MSYARFSEGDIYIYEHVHGRLVCENCLFRPPLPTPPGLRQLRRNHPTRTRRAMLHHIASHAASGHAIPDRTVPTLTLDLNQHGNKVKTPKPEHLRAAGYKPMAELFPEAVINPNPADDVWAFVLPEDFHANHIAFSGAEHPALIITYDFRLTTRDITTLTVAPDEPYHDALPLLEYIEAWRMSLH